MIPAFELDGITFGGDSPIQVESFDPGAPSFTAQDVDNPVGDGTFFGRDFLHGQTWAFDLFTNVSDASSALALAEQLGEVWLSSRNRSTPGKVIPLRYWMWGRWRVVYGRPSRWAGPDGGMMTSLGVGKMSADFKRADHLHYEDFEGSSNVSLMPSTVGGFVFPVDFPLDFQEATEETYAPGTFVVGGTAPTGAIIEINGPVSDPWVGTEGGWVAGFNGTIGAGDTITLDARPWARTVLRNGVPTPGLLKLTTRLADLVLEPGVHRITFGGSGDASQAYATIKWRNAYYSL